MKCAKIQEYLITDYTDNCLEGKQKSLIDRHLAHCRACGKFLVNVRETTNHLKKAPQLVPEASLWLQIRQTIETTEEPAVGNFIADFWERLRAAVHVPRPAFALATVLTMIFMIGTVGQFFINAPVVQTINGQDQVEYLSSLLTEGQDTLSSEPQTPIEKYFL